MNFKNKYITDSGSSTSIWMEGIELPKFAKLEQNIDTDVCIIGGGFIGIMTAYHLLKKEKKVVLLEDGPLTGGATGRTTAHLTNVLDDRYYELISLFGEENAKKAATSHEKAVDRIESIILNEGIACDFERVDAYLFCSPGESKEVLEKEHNACMKVGLQSEFVEKVPFPDFDTGKALYFKKQAQFHPLKFLKGIIEKITAMGGKIYCNTHAAKIQEERSRCLVETTDGFKVNCRSVVVATNVPINDRVYIHTKQAPYRTYVIAGKIPKGYLPSALYYDTPDPYHYLRVYNGEFLIVGGEDHRTGECSHPEDCYQELEKWTRKRVPALGEIEFRWSGQIIEPVDCLAFIGKNPGNEHIFIATGDSGNGLTHGTIAALLFTDLITGERNSWEDLYRPNRKNIHSLDEYISENANTALQYGDWFSKGDEGDIQPGEGKIKNKQAIYKDENGCIHKSSAICPHLAGIVRWNSAEKTWDCPCHGSRFDPYGKVINGPANKDLTKDNEKSN